MRLTACLIRGGSLVVGCIVVLGCGEAIQSPENEGAFETIQTADAVTWYEGLPHPEVEPTLFSREKEQKRTVNLHGFDFYAEPLQIPASEQTNVLNVLADKTSFDRWHENGKCDGFHPDICLQWRQGAATYELLICLGCSKAKLYGPVNRVRYGLPDRSGLLSRFIERYRTNRPPRRSG